MTKYTYRVVSSNGAASYGPSIDWKSLKKAQDSARRIAAARITVEPIEIQRVEHLRDRPTGSHRLCMRKGSRWATWDPHQEIEQRKPDFFVQHGTVTE